MKFRTSALLVLLALPLIIVPSVTKADVNPRIWVNPGETKFWAPCQISNEFEIEIKLWNKEEITGEAIYAFDFKVTWNPDVIGFVSAEVFPPWPEGEYFIVKDFYNATYPYYHLAITALDTAPPLDDHQLVLVKITFHIEDEPCCGYLHSDIDIFDVEVSTPCGSPITTDVVDGDVYIYSSTPFMWLDPSEFTYGCISSHQEVSVMLTNITKAKGFRFTITWNNSDLLEANIQCVHVTDLFPPPYASYEVEVGEDYVSVEVEMPFKKPEISCVEGPIVTICFHTIFANLTKGLPKVEDVSIDFASAQVKYCTSWRTVPSAGAVYHWTPKVEDLDLSCHVDITDLSAIAAEYGKYHVWSELAPSTTAPVDIYDIVVVAKKFCKTEP